MEAPVQPKPGLSIQDILFILFRHKWKIIFFTLLGAAGAATIWFTQKPVYQARAKLLIRYVTETRDVLGTGPEQGEVVRDPDSRGTTIINSEIEILSSQDSFVEVVRDLGAERILAAYEGGTNATEAAAILRSSLQVEAGRNSSVITVFLGHRDPVIAREALDTLIQEYLRRHVDAHRAVGTYDILQAQTDQLRARLAQTEEQLRREKNQANIISLEQSKTDIATQRSALRTAIFQAEAELAELGAQLASHQPGETAPTADGAEAAGTPTNQLAAAASPSSREMADFKRLSERLSGLLANRDQLLAVFQPDSSAVKTVQVRIEEVEKALSDLGFDPALAVNRTTSATGESLVFDVAGARNRGLALEAKLAVYRKQLQQVEEQARLIDSVENNILSLERKREVDDEKLRYFESNLERARFDQAMDSGKVNNITLVEAPTPAGLDTEKIMKLVLGVFGGAVGLGLALSFGWELLIDPTFKRPREVENALGLPLMATIPKITSPRRKRREEKRAEENLPQGLQEIGLPRAEIAPWNDEDPMLPYYEALRDRVVMSYNGDTHKPKIVGVTSCSHGAGVTRLSLGLAAALSRDAERNVLFIALERNKVSLTAFAKGVPREALPLHPGPAEPHPQPDPWPAPRDSQIDADEQVTVQKNLVSLATTGRNLAGASIVQSFSDLMPKLKGADYDYIIFDLPPITQTSGSLRLATQMERTLMVVEAEKTHKDKVARARKLINGAPTQLFTVLNKTKSYGPKSLDDAI